MSSTAEKIIGKKIEQTIQGVTPGLCVQAYHRGEMVIDLSIGKTYRYYDWASLTKIVFTATLVMALEQDCELTVEQSVQSKLPWYKYGQVRVRDLLTHSSGHRAWAPYFEQLAFIEKDERTFSQKLRMLLKDEKLSLPAQCIYSDIGIMLLGVFLETLTKKSLLEMWRPIKEGFGLMETNFHRDNKAMSNIEDFAPTEDCKWRKKIIQGEVFDDNTWALGGISSHAGLFGPIGDLSRWGLQMRAKSLGEGKHNIFERATVQKFFTKSTELGDWGLGFMKPTPGKASCGKYFGKNSVGHTGFTGTSFWWDPDVDLLVTILSNRTFPDRENIKFRDLRASIHDWIFEEVVK